jgi:hypothetical protein
VRPSRLVIDSQGQPDLYGRTWETGRAPPIHGPPDRVLGQAALVGRPIAAPTRACRPAGIRRQGMVRSGR